MIRRGPLLDLGDTLDVQGAVAKQGLYHRRSVGAGL